MDFVTIVAVLAVLQFIVFSVLVGTARGTYGVKAPAVQGHEMFDRAFRVQMNTLEQLVCFLPALLLANLHYSDGYIALLGAVYLVGRLLYRQAYIKDPSTRAVGFILSLVPTVLLLIAAFIGAITA